MKKLFTAFVLLFMAVAPLVAQTVPEKSINIIASSLHPVQTDALTGVNIDPIQTDMSNRPCARIKMRVNRMTKAEIGQLEIKIIGGNAQVVRRMVADDGNGLIFEVTARPNLRFYIQHSEFGESNDVQLAVEGNKEYYLDAELNQLFTITIASNTADAEIYIDEKFVGRTVKNGADYLCTVKDILPGEHKLYLKYGGISTTAQSININSAGSLFFRQNVNMAASRYQFVVLQVEPKNAVVMIENKVYTSEDGVISEYLPNGTYRYKVSAQNYHDKSDAFTLAGQKLNMSISLQPAFGWIDIRGGNVDGAMVYINDAYIGKAPIKSNAMASGEYTIRIVKELYQSDIRKVVVRDNSVTTHNITLNQDFANVSISAGQNTQIWINKKQYGTGRWTGRLQSGVYLCEARREGYRTVEQTITVEPQSTILNIKLEEPKPIYGSLIITATPTIVDVSIDGEKVGETPLQLDNVIIGNRKITLSKVGYNYYTTSVIVAENTTQRITATLAKIVPPATSYSQPASAKPSARTTSASVPSTQQTSAPYKVGDYYNENGKEGVVFEVDATGRHGKIVALTQSSKGLQWCVREEFERTAKGNAATSETDGVYNMSEIKKIYGWREKYPAFAYCASLGDGWYLPAKKELEKLMVNSTVYNAVNETLFFKNQTTLSKKRYYWSSTQNGRYPYNSWCYYASGSMYFNYKHSSYTVRAVSTF